MNILDMAPIYKSPKVKVYEGLWKYENTQFSRPGLKKFDHENYYIYYSCEERYLDGKIVCKDNIGKEYKINMKSDLNKACGIHISLRNMDLNEKAVFRVSPLLRKSLDQLEYQTENKVVQYATEQDKAKAEQDQIWIIEIIKVVEKFDHVTYSFDNRSNQIEMLNKNAQSLFQKDKYKEAFDQYKQIRVYSDGIPNEQKQKWTEEQCNYMYNQTTKSYINQAVCSLKMKEWHLVKDLCNSALLINPNNTKGILQQKIKAKILVARSMFERRLLEEAKVLFQKILDDENLAKTEDQIIDVQNYLNQCSYEYSTKKEKIVYQKIFEKINEKDADLDRMEKTHKLEEYEKVKQIKKILDDAQNGGITKENEFSKLI